MSLTESVTLTLMRTRLCSYKLAANLFQVGPEGSSEKYSHFVQIHLLKHFSFNQKNYALHLVSVLVHRGHGRFGEEE